MNPKRILLVDDDPDIRLTVKPPLEAAGYQVSEAANFADGQTAVTNIKPDLIVLDLMLPEIDGFDVCRILRREVSTPILMLTARDDEIDRVVGLEVGADDYLTKPFNPPEVVARVKAILRRSSGALKPPAVVQIRGLRLDLERHTVTIDDRVLELTPTEFDLLRVLLQNPGRAPSRAAS